MLFATAGRTRFVSQNTYSFSYIKLPLQLFPSFPTLWYLSEGKVCHNNLKQIKPKPNIFPHTAPAWQLWGLVCRPSSICQALLAVISAGPDVFSSLVWCPLASRIDSCNESPGRMSPPSPLPPFPEPSFTSQPVLQRPPKQQLIPGSLDSLDEGLGQSLACGSWW